MFSLGYDIGSSSIKAALVHAESGKTVALTHSPEREMGINAPKPGWAEQDPTLWWDHVCRATQKILKETSVDPVDIKGIGIAYQMHGLVCVDEDQNVLRPSIIWCDGRAVDIGAEAFASIGQEECLSSMLNSPGNFTASKLAWVKEYEPELYQRIAHILLPGDYIAMRLTGEVMTTPSGLSEGILWDFKKNKVSDMVLNHFGFDASVIPPVVPSLSDQGKVKKKAAEETGLAVGTPVTFRAGDQPNNAMSLNVLQPGEVAATGGTSGVVYGVVDSPRFDPQSRVNSFLHVNHEADTQERIGVLLCINGAGIQYSWVKNEIASRGTDFNSMEKLASEIPIGSEGLRMLPFGNGAERMLGNRDIGSQVHNLRLTRHTRHHMYRAALEGVAFSFVYGMSILKEMGMKVDVMRVGNDNLFLSGIFSQTIANLVGCRIEVADATGAVGAAKAAGVVPGLYPSLDKAMGNIQLVKTYESDVNKTEHEAAYQRWHGDLMHALNKDLTIS